MTRSASLFSKIRSNPSKALASVHVDDLVAMLEAASDAYYNQGTSVLSDDLFDMAKDELSKRDPQHPYLRQIGAPISKGEKAKLPYWMGSLDKIRDDPKAFERWLGRFPGSYVVSDKLDGNSALIVYTRANHASTSYIPRMYSRGDGVSGADISHMLPHIQGVPPIMHAPLAVRGELIVSKANWESMSHIGANARNVVAGAMHRKTVDAHTASKIEFVAYELMHPRTEAPGVSFVFLKEHGFREVAFHVVEQKHMSVDYLSQYLMKRRSASPYECDGIVVQHNAIHPLVSGSNPKYAFAFKSILTHEEAEVVVSHVEWNVSKDGYIKPTIHFPVVSIAGVGIQRATGFNASFIEKHGIGPGSRIVVIRSGDVIPYVVRVLQPSASGEWQMPDIPYAWTESHVDVVVQDTDSREQRLRELEHFAKTLEIPYIAMGTLKKLVDAGFDTIPKLLDISVEDLLQIDGFQRASATRIHRSLARVRSSATCLEMMAASNVFGRGLGAKKLDVIVKALPSVLKKKVPSKEDVQTVPGIGPATATSFVEGLPRFYAFMESINMPCHVDDSASSPTANLHLADLRVVFTGFRNKEWESQITRAGGHVSSVVSGKTTHLVAMNPDEVSSKVQKAHTLGIPVLSKVAFASAYRLV